MSFIAAVTIIDNDELVIPYAMADVMSGIATVGVKELINSMQPVV